MTLELLDVKKDATTVEAASEPDDITIPCIAMTSQMLFGNTNTTFVVEPELHQALMATHKSCQRRQVKRPI
jgi:hypothetical protein